MYYFTIDYLKIPCLNIILDIENKTVEIKKISKENKIDFIINENSEYEDVIDFIQSRVNVERPWVKEVLGEISIFEAIALSKGEKISDPISISLKNMSISI